MSLAAAFGWAAAFVIVGYFSVVRPPDMAE
jgi:hypothetical protein